MGICLQQAPRYGDWLFCVGTIESDSEFVPEEITFTGLLDALDLVHRPSIELRRLAGLLLIVVDHGLHLE